MKLIKGKLVLNGIAFDNPIDRFPLPKREYREWKETERTSYKAIWLDRYVEDEHFNQIGYESWELKKSNRNKFFLDDKEIKNQDEIESCIEIFNSLKIDKK